jgi:hypothetical protein
MIITLPPDHPVSDLQVKKVYGKKLFRNRRRKWRLGHMEGLHNKAGAEMSSQGSML